MNLALSGRGTQLITAALRAGNITPCAKIMLCIRRNFIDYIVIQFNVNITYTESQMHEVDLTRAVIFKRN
jgi:hypothetical protein